MDVSAKANFFSKAHTKYGYSLPLEPKTAHPCQVLMDLNQPLLAFGLYEAWPVDEVLVDLLQRLLKVL